jgi:hypothetical protein
LREKQHSPERAVTRNRAIGVRSARWATGTRYGRFGITQPAELAASSADLGFEFAPLAGVSGY